MNELMEKVDNLILSLEETEEVQKYKELQEKIMKEKELLDDLEKYQQNPDGELKKKILSHPLFRVYHHQETELNLLILKINQEFKKIGNTKVCHKNENH